MATASKSTPPQRPQTTAESIRETLESIVIAFILAFVFRAFIVEAFVIPTGSMASTLYGAQIVHTCSVCGYEYARGATLQESQVKSFSSGYNFRCPNCNTTTDPVQDQRANSGDRILVHKWPFHLPVESFKADRWEVIVFKDPSDGATNYIKRCVGLPGEIFEIIDGDVYTAPLDKVRQSDPTLIDDLLQLRREVHELRILQEDVRSGRRPMSNPFVANGGMEIVNRYAEINERVLPLLEIREKTPKAQESLFFNVYDHDYLPNYSRLSTPDSGRVGWHPDGPAAAEAWDPLGREVAFNSQSDQWLAVEFRGKQIDDFIAYNVGSPGPNAFHQPVGDLRLRFNWQPASRTGGLQLELTRDLDRFAASIMADGSYAVQRHHPSEDGGESIEEVGRGKLSAFDGLSAHEIEFSQVDYRVTLRINGEVAATRAFSPSVEKLKRILQDYRNGRTPQIEPSRVRIAAQQGVHKLRHLALERDVYYRSDRQSENKKFNVKLPGRKALIDRENPYEDWPGWGTANMPILLLEDDSTASGDRQHGEYFMCGDNSPASKDSRLWWEIGDHLASRGAEYRVGTVPEDQLIGEAFFVYWPSGYRRFWAGNVGLVPNFGGMRWIR